MWFGVSQYTRYIVQEQHSVVARKDMALAIIIIVITVFILAEFPLTRDETFLYASRSILSVCGIALV